MSETVRVCIVGNDDDWEGIYINGRLANEGHRVAVRDVLDAVKGKTLIDYEYRTCDRQWLYDHGNLPDDLERVRWLK